MSLYADVQLSFLAPPTVDLSAHATHCLQAIGTSDDNHIAIARTFLEAVADRSRSAGELVAWGGHGAWLEPEQIARALTPFFTEVLRDAPKHQALMWWSYEGDPCLDEYVLFLDAEGELLMSESASLPLTWETVFDDDPDEAVFAVKDHVEELPSLPRTRLLLAAGYHNQQARDRWCAAATEVRGEVEGAQRALVDAILSRLGPLAGHFTWSYTGTVDMNELVGGALRPFWEAALCDETVIVYGEAAGERPIALALARVAMDHGAVEERKTCTFLKRNVGVGHVGDPADEHRRTAANAKRERLRLEREEQERRASRERREAEAALERSRQEEELLERARSWDQVVSTELPPSSVLRLGPVRTLPVVAPPSRFSVWDDLAAWVETVAETGKTKIHAWNGLNAESWEFEGTTSLSHVDARGPIVWQSKRSKVWKTVARTGEICAQWTTPKGTSRVKVFPCDSPWMLIASLDRSQFWFLHTSGEQVPAPKAAESCTPIVFGDGLGFPVEGAGLGVYSPTLTRTIQLPGELRSASPRASGRYNLWLRGAEGSTGSSTTTAWLFDPATLHLSSIGAGNELLTSVHGVRLAIAWWSMVDGVPYEPNEPFVTMTDHAGEAHPMPETRGARSFHATDLRVFWYTDGATCCADWVLPERSPEAHDAVDEPEPPPNGRPWWKFWG